MAIYSGMNTGDFQVGGGPCKVDKLGNRLAGEAGDGYTIIIDIV